MTDNMTKCQLNSITISGDVLNASETAHSKHDTDNNDNNVINKIAVAVNNSQNIVWTRWHDSKLTIEILLIIQLLI